MATTIANVVRAHESDGHGFDVVLPGKDAAGTGDFQVPERLAGALDRPVLTNIAHCQVDGDRVIARGDGPDGTEIFKVPLPVSSRCWRVRSLRAIPRSPVG